MRCILESYLKKLSYSILEEFDKLSEAKKKKLATKAGIKKAVKTGAKIGGSMGATTLTHGALVGAGVASGGATAGIIAAQLLVTYVKSRTLKNKIIKQQSIVKSGNDKKVAMAKVKLKYLIKERNMKLKHLKKQMSKASPKEKAKFKKKILKYKNKHKIE